MEEKKKNKIILLVFITVFITGIILIAIRLPRVIREHQRKLKQVPRAETIQPYQPSVKELVEETQGPGERRPLDYFYPEIPHWIQDAVRSDTVLFSTEITIDDTGRVIDQELQSGTGIFELDNLLLSTVREWLYTESNDEREKRLVRIEVDFRPSRQPAE